MKNPIICVDFDGVIHSYTSGWKGADVIDDLPVPGAIEWLQEHLPVPDGLGGHCVEHRGPIVQIYSSRSKERSGVKAMKNWLIKHGLPRQYIHDGILQFPTQKPSAFLTIDDRAICFNGQFPSAQEMMSFKPWNKCRIEKLTGSEVDTLVALVECGPLSDGYEPSKSARDSLIDKGLAIRIVNKLEDGWTAATYAGKESYKSHFGTPLEGSADTLHEARANRIARRIIINAGHKS